MSRRGLFLAVGFVWGVVISFAVALTVSAAVAGVAWIYLFGDSPWPDWANWAILGAGGSAGLLAFVVSMTVARIVANRYDGGEDARDGDKGGSSFAWFLLVLGLAAAGGFAWHEFGRQQDAQTERDQAAAAVQFFPVMLSETHRVAGIAVEWPGGGRDGSARIALDGLRNGAYRLAWQVRGNQHGTSLLSGEETLQLTSGPQSMDIPLPAQRIVEGYRENLSRQDANVMVDEPFLFEAELAPVPSEEESARMPAQEVRNLADGQSSLIDRSSAEFPVRFFLNGGTLSWD